MSIKPSLPADRRFVLDQVNEELQGEGLPHVHTTNRAVISEQGIIWHELEDDHGYFSYATSFSFNHRNVTVVAEVSEAMDFDEQMNA